MKTQSAKAKGRRFQQWVRDKLIEVLDIHPEDIEVVLWVVVVKILSWQGARNLSIFNRM